MKKMFFTAWAVLMMSPIFAGTKLTSGDLSELAQMKKIPVVVNWEQSVYGKGGNVENFLATAPRDPEWEAKSMAPLYQEANEKTAPLGLIFVDSASAPDSKYVLEIIVYTISKGGDIKGEIVTKERGSNTPVSTIAFSSDESDDNDKIAFKDQFESIGESLGKLVSKQLKRVRK
jgi:hypothetical protein